jgi:hypothetical protein
LYATSRGPVASSAAALPLAGLKTLAGISRQNLSLKLISSTCFHGENSAPLEQIKKTKTVNDFF